MVFEYFRGFIEMLQLHTSFDVMKWFVCECDQMDDVCKFEYLFGHTWITIAMIEMNMSIASKECIEYITVAMLLPPRAQLSIPHTVHAIDERRMFVANQRIVILIAQMPFEFVFAGNALHVHCIQ